MIANPLPIREPVTSRGNDKFSGESIGERISMLSRRAVSDAYRNFLGGAVLGEPHHPMFRQRFVALHGRLGQYGYTLRDVSGGEDAFTFIPSGKEWCFGDGYDPLRLGCGVHHRQRGLDGSREVCAVGQFQCTNGFQPRHTPVAHRVRIFQTQGLPLQRGCKALCLPLRSFPAVPAHRAQYRPFRLLCR